MLLVTPLEEIFPFPVTAFRSKRTLPEMHVFEGSKPT